MLKGNLSCHLCRLLPEDAPLFADGPHSWGRKMLFLVSTGVLLFCLRIVIIRLVAWGKTEMAPREKLTK